jgi:hypothetical protein
VAVIGLQNPPYFESQQAISQPQAFAPSVSAPGKLKSQVDIPCPGHASLISGGLRKISGVANVRFSMPDIFEVRYDPLRASKEQILAVDVFGSYQAMAVG